MQSPGKASGKRPDWLAACIGFITRNTIVEKYPIQFFKYKIMPIISSDKNKVMDEREEGTHSGKDT